MRSPCQRIGHGGASALAPANTLESFDAAREVGVDVIEFDVRAHGRDLVLAHTLLDARRGDGLRLARALAHLRSRAFSGIDLNVDLKRTGCEAAVLEALRDASLLHRTLISSQVPHVLDQVRALEPDARVGISVGGRVARASRRLGDWRRYVLTGLAARRWDAVMAQHRLVSPGLLAQVIDCDGLLYAWTVNRREAIERLRGLGVHGITTADPRLFV